MPLHQLRGRRWPDRWKFIKVGFISRVSRSIRPYRPPPTPRAVHTWLIIWFIICALWILVSFVFKRVAHICQWNTLYMPGRKARQRVVQLLAYFKRGFDSSSPHKTGRTEGWLVYIGVDIILHMIQRLVFGGEAKGGSTVSIMKCRFILISGCCYCIYTYVPVNPPYTRSWFNCSRLKQCPVIYIYTIYNKFYEKRKRKYQIRIIRRRLLCIFDIISRLPWFSEIFVILRRTHIFQIEAISWTNKNPKNVFDNIGRSVS